MPPSTCIFSPKRRRIAVIIPLSYWKRSGMKGKQEDLEVKTKGRNKK